MLSVGYSTLPVFPIPVKYVYIPKVKLFGNYFPINYENSTLHLKKPLTRQYDLLTITDEHDIKTYL